MLEYYSTYVWRFIVPLIKNLSKFKSILNSSSVPQNVYEDWILIYPIFGNNTYKN